MIIVLEIRIIVICIVSCVKSSVLYRRIIITHELYDIVYILYKLYYIVKSYVSYDT